MGSDDVAFLICEVEVLLGFAQGEKGMLCCVSGMVGFVPVVQIIVVQHGTAHQLAIAYTQVKRVSDGIVAKPVNPHCREKPLSCGACPYHKRPKNAKNRPF